MVVYQRGPRERIGCRADGSDRGAGDQRRRSEVGDDGAGERRAEDLAKDGMEEETRSISTS